MNETNIVKHKKDFNHYCVNCGISTTKFGIYVGNWLPLYRKEIKFNEGWYCLACAEKTARARILSIDTKEGKQK